MIGDPLTEIRDVLAKMSQQMATFATRDDLAQSIAATRDDLAQSIAATRDELAAIAGRMATRDELAAIAGRMATRDHLIRTRSEIMERIDRLEGAISLQHEERIVDVGSAERSERMAKAAQEDAHAIGRIVTPLVRLVHGMRTQLDDLAEQVRLLKERPPAA